MTATAGITDPEELARIERGDKVEFWLRSRLEASSLMEEMIEVRKEEIEVAKSKKVVFKLNERR